ncbi:unnamed protein product [Prunus armeniaca]
MLFVRWQCSRILETTGNVHGRGQSHCETSISNPRCVCSEPSVPLNDIEVQVVNVGQARGVSSFGCFFCYRLCSNQCFPEVAKARTMRIRIHGLVYLNFYRLI